MRSSADPHNFLLLKLLQVLEFLSQPILDAFPDSTFIEVTLITSPLVRPGIHL